MRRVTGVRRAQGGMVKEKRISSWKWRTWNALVVLLGVVVALVACSSPHEGPKDNVVLIIIDTIRPDRLGCYGYDLPTSPNIDAFAEHCTVFTQAVTCAPLTLPSVTAILTSTYPVFNNVRYNGMFYMGKSSISLAEILEDEGYNTAAFIGGFPLDSQFGTDQGFKTYDDDFSNSARRRRYGWIGHAVDDFERTAAEVNQRVFDWLEDAKDEPFFLTVHYFDPHLPYTPLPPFNDAFEDPYDGEVAYTDKHVGALLNRLKELGLDENTLIILTGDHGESLGTHNEVTHGEFIFDTTVKIPLMLYHRDRIPAGWRIDVMVRSIDIMPTILDFLNVPASPHTQGVSLLPALKGDLEERPILLEATLHYFESENLAHDPIMITGLRTGQWKLVHVTVERQDGTGWMGELYNVVEDPDELNDVKDEQPEKFDELTDEMRALIRTNSADSLPKTNYLKMTDETREKLKALGYLK
jgi:arylsulfatase A-like enzyme